MNEELKTTKTSTCTWFSGIKGPWVPVFGRPSVKGNSEGEEDCVRKYGTSVFAKPRHIHEYEKIDIDLDKTAILVQWDSDGGNSWLFWHHGIVGENWQCLMSLPCYCFCFTVVAELWGLLGERQESVVSTSTRWSLKLGFVRNNLLQASWNFLSTTYILHKVLLAWTRINKFKNTRWNHCNKARWFLTRHSANNYPMHEIRKEEKLILWSVVSDVFIR